MEEFVKYTIIMRPHFDLFGDRYSERVERRAKATKAAATAEKANTSVVSLADESAAAGTSASAQSDRLGNDRAGKDIVNGVNVLGI